MPEEKQAKLKIVELSREDVDELHVLTLKFIRKLSELEAALARAKDKPPEPKPTSYEARYIDGEEFSD